MNSADVWAWFLIITGTWLTLVSCWLAAVGLAPRMVEACAERYGRRPILATVVGALVLVPMLGIAAVGSKLPNPALAAVGTMFAFAPALVALLGSAGLALRIGAGLASPDDAFQPWRRVLRGGTVLGLTFLLPLLGWFVLLPWTLVSGFGAAVLVVCTRRDPAIGAAAGAVATAAGDAPSVIASAPAPRATP